VIQEARQQAAVEMVGRYEQALKRTARRYSLDAEDVEDAYQRALEIVLTKAPTTDPGELIRWTQTVIKHEALAVRRNRERLLGLAPLPGAPAEDPVALLPARGDGPEVQAERSEDVALAREALRALKPAELQTLTLLAAGYSYAEIADITGFSLTKVNRCLAEGRERFRSLLQRSESGARCGDLRPLISAFCDGEADSREAAAVREHLRACPHCRATMRTYRAAPRLASALIPALPLRRSLLARARDLISGLGSHAAAIKQLALCAGVAGTAAAGVTTGVLPSPVGGSESTGARPVSTSERPARPVPARDANGPAKQRKVEPKRTPPPDHRAVAEASPEPEAPEYEAAVEAPPTEEATAAPEASTDSGSAAGEFGP